MEITTYRRHSADCKHKDDRYHPRCGCQKKPPSKPFPYLRVLKMWKAGKSSMEIAKTVGHYDSKAADPIHSFRVTLTRFHKGVFPLVQANRLNVNSRRASQFANLHSEIIHPTLRYRARKYFSRQLNT